MFYSLTVVKIFFSAIGIRNLLIHSVVFMDIASSKGCFTENTF